MLAARFADALYRYRRVLFALWLVHAFVLHYYVLGFYSWDGFGYRTTPIVELLQHGHLNGGKFNDWTFRGHIPFLELVHLPFIAVFGMFAFVRELTGDRRAATFGAFAYVALPMVNQQPFTGYIDFAAGGVLAFFLYALLRLRAGAPRRAAYIRLGIATLLFTMARMQGIYVVAVLFPLLGYALFCARERLRIRIVRRRELGLAALAVVVGSLPAIALQLYKLQKFGSPIAPMKFELLGLASREGVPLEDYFRYAGLDGSDLGSLAKGFFEGWIWHADWPIGAFFASRFMGAGLVFVLAVVLLPAALRRASRVELAVLGAGVLVSLLSRDFAVPRWSYTLVLAIAVVVGRGMSELAESRRGRPLFWVAALVLVLHMLRPEVDLLQLPDGYVTPRMNATGSPWFEEGVNDELRLYPDRGLKLVIIEATGFQLQLYGRRLTNRVLGTMRKQHLDDRCTRLSIWLEKDPDALFVDDQDLTKLCERTCVVKWPDAPLYCGAWKIVPHVWQ
jgi:4-amino-4-deoxy-L-arabinose transferase-like glycosyltransferase